MAEAVVIIGAGVFQKPLIEKAHSMGFETHVFAWEDGAVCKDISDFFYPVSIVDIDRIELYCHKIKPVAIASIASDLAAITVNTLADRLGLPCNSAKCVRQTTNKYAMRCALKKAGIPVPEFVEVDRDSAASGAAALGLSYPLIVKPTDRSGSRGIALVHDDDTMREAVDAAVSYSFEKKAIIETYLEGDEYSCEAISSQGHHHILAFTKKETTGAPGFIETGHMEPAGFSPDREAHIARAIISALDALQITCGASHSEFRVDRSGNPRIIEIGARMGGDCIGSHLVYLSSGYDFLGMVLDVAAGKAPDLEKKGPSGVSAVKFIFDQADVERMNRILQASPKSVAEISPIHFHNQPIVDSASRFGYYVLTAPNAQEMERVLAL
jgi:biotin carboxylase